MIEIYSAPSAFSTPTEALALSQFPVKNNQSMGLLTLAWKSAAIGFHLLRIEVVMWRNTNTEEILLSPKLNVFDFFRYGKQARRSLNRSSNICSALAQF